MSGYHCLALSIAFLAAVTFIEVASAQSQRSIAMPAEKPMTPTRVVKPSTQASSKQGLAGVSPKISLPVKSCPSTALRADVVAIDHPMVFNRLGAQNVNWMMYALRHDVVRVKKNAQGDDGYVWLGHTGNDPEWDALLNAARTDKSGPLGQAHRRESLHVSLRPDLRPRPLVLRMPAGGYLRVQFTNLLERHAIPPHEHPGNPFDEHLTGFPQDHPMAKRPPLRIDDQVASRVAGFHPQGLELVPVNGKPGIHSDSSSVGQNPDSTSNGLNAKAGSMIEPGRSTEYCFFAPEEGAYLISNPGAVFGGEGTAGDSGVGLFGVVAVEPTGGRPYRAQITEEEIRLATIKPTPTGQPIIDYQAKYPEDCPSGIWCQEHKNGRPILSMIHNGRIIHGDINAIIMGPNPDGSFPPSTYPIERDTSSSHALARNPTLPNRLEPFREFVSVFHDENAATQSYPYFFDHPELKHTLHGVRDAFMINYGSGGIGSEIIANRLHTGPMHDCLDCAYEEFFLSSFVVGDAAMIVDHPANMETHQCQPEFLPTPEEKEAGTWPNKARFEKFCVQRTWATEAYYPHDPANLHHSYIGDFVKFRNVHSGKEQHIFHLHNHQWLFNPNDDNSNYIDAQGLGPGSGYTYEIAFGGSGNRNKTVGDAIFHCHFYPHFAQGMWYMWRNHDVFESGTRLAVSDTASGFHERPFGLMHGKPSEKARALPDGEIAAGTPIPAIVPLPGKGMAPMPLPVRVKPRIGDDGRTHGSVAEVSLPKKVGPNENPGFPFWVAGVSQRVGHSHDSISMGSRPTTPPLDMAAIAGGHDGGLPRHALAGYSAEGHDHSEITRLTAVKHIEEAKPVYYDEGGTPLEQIAMKFHAQRIHPTTKVDTHHNQSPAEFITNGAPPTPGAPFNDPCIDDKGTPLLSTQHGLFFGGRYGEYFSSVQDLPGGIEFGSDHPRVYKGANVQLDVVFNKLGYHYPQQRILALWEDVPTLLTRQRPPEPLVLRMNTYDCAVYQHTNLVPKEFFLDDYQITTPTDVIGQHIHLPKWDLTSADGGANGFNYEDGTFSPGAVRERIQAINEWNKRQVAQGKPQIPQPNGSTSPLVPTAHPYFGKDPIFQHGPNVLQAIEEICLKAWTSAPSLKEFEKDWGIPGKCDWFGARTTLQRWFSDPVVNRGLIHRGLGITFTHDHLGPSTHQQLGLYATMLTEPPGSLWRQNETGDVLYNPAVRQDGGPTSWQAVIAGKNKEPIDVDGDKRDDSHREFFLQFGDFQHAYEKNVFAGVDEKGKPINEIGVKEGDLKFVKLDATRSPSRMELSQAFRHAINPSYRKPADRKNPADTKEVAMDIFKYPPTCPGGVTKEDERKDPLLAYDNKSAPNRPCPEAISADDVGMMVVNYRNEPIGARVYDPKVTGPDGKKGTQTAGGAGDLDLAMTTRTDRALGVLNGIGGEDPSIPATTPHYPNDVNQHRLLGDPYTPIMRAYSGDLIRVKIQAGSHEHEHNGSINALGWMQGGSGFGQAPHSGWRNAQNTGLSEQFTFSARMTDYWSDTFLNDRMYAIDTSQDGLWNGVWGILRSKSKLDRKDALVKLPSNPVPTVLGPEESMGKDNVCPKDAAIREYHIAVVLANRALSNSLSVTIPSARNSGYPNGSSRLNSGGGTLVYNPRSTSIAIEVKNEDGKVVRTESFGTGPLHDPTAILFVRESDLDTNGTLMPGMPLEPLVLRAAAGECIQVVLHNRLPKGRRNMPDLDGLTSLSGIIHRDDNDASGSVTTFNNNLVRPSNRIGLHSQLLHYNVQTSDGNNVGVNKIGTIRPNEQHVYQWYAGVLEPPSLSDPCPVPVSLNTLPRAHALLSLFPRLARNGDQPTRSPAQILTKAAFGERVRAVLNPDYFETGEIAVHNATEVVNALTILGERAKLFVPEQTTDKPQPILSVTPPLSALSKRRFMAFQAATAADPERFTALTKILEQPSITDKERQALADHVPLLGRAAYIDTLAGLEGLVSPDGADPAELVRKRIDELSRIFAGANAEFKINVSPEVTRRLAQSLFFESFEYPTKTSYQWWDQIFPNMTLDLSQETIRVVQLSGKSCRYTPVEFGGTNLTPSDRIKQGQKAAVGALVVEPEKSFWIENADDRVLDRQTYPVSPANNRASRATAFVFYPADGRTRFFRDVALVHQKGLGHRYQDGSAVATLAAEKEGANENPLNIAPEDAHDSGHMAINYGTEPQWFRFGLPADAPFGKDGFGGVHHAWEAFSDQCCHNGGTATTATQPTKSPYIPIVSALAGHELRLRALLPTGIGRATVFSLHGHNWPRDPYLAERSSSGHPVGARPADWGVPSKCIGNNALHIGMGGQESLTPMAHFDEALKSAGGQQAVPGDYLWQDHGGFGITSGAWSIVRVVPSARSKNRLFSPVPLRTACEIVP